MERRRGVARGKRVALAQVEQVLGLYGDRYFDLKVRHFHQKLSAEQQMGLSYTWVKQGLQGAGVVKREPQRGVHRQRRAGWPLPGMMLHIGGGRHRQRPTACSPSTLWPSSTAAFRCRRRSVERHSSLARASHWI